MEVVPANKSFKEISRGRIWMKPTDQLDLWLDSQGFYRKHTAKDGSCLYRVVSEQVFLAQAFHLQVRRQCAEYARRHPELLDEVTHCTKEEYVDRMKHPHEAGGKLELKLMSLMYKRDFILFYETGKTFKPVTENGFDKQIMLCLSQDHHYDSVYTKQYISNAAFCQSLVYETLYKKVFQLQEVDYAVNKMLHDKNNKYQRDPSSFIMNGLDLRLEIRDSYVNVKNLLTLGVTPFPYKVAKSLDPDIYRNVEYDTWNDLRRGLRYGTYVWSNRELQVGVKCLVKLPTDRVCHAHIQDMEPDKGPVLVYVEELGEKMRVAYENLELLPHTPPQPISLPLKQLRQLQTLRELTSLAEELESFSNDDKNNNQDAASTPCSEKENIWKSDLQRENANAHKLRLNNDTPRSSKKSNRPYRMRVKEQSISENHKHQIEDNTVVSSSSDSHHPQAVITHHRGSLEDYNNSNGYSYQEAINQRAERERQAEAPGVNTVPPALLCVEPHFYMQTHAGESYVPPATAYLAPPAPGPAPACFPAPDMQVPLTDITPLRFYYNCGIDPFPRTARPTPPCYLNTAVTYVPDPSLSPAVFENGSTPINTPDSAVVMTPSPVFRHQRPDSLPLLQEADSTSHHYPPTPTSHNIAPRFKNKLRNMQAARPCEPVQQPEVSSTTGMPLPPPLLPPPTHYLPPLPSLYPLYHPLGLEFEAFTTPNYLEYSVYDPNLLYYQTVPPAYMHPDTLFYQHIVAPPPAPPAI